MKAKIITVTALFLLLLMTGCGLIQEPKDAEAVMDKYYATIKAKDFDKTMTFYTADFFTSPSSQIGSKEWRNVLSRIQDKLGNMQTYKITSWKVTSYAGTDRVGTIYDFQCDVTYSKGTAIETLKLFKPAGGSDQDLKVLGHHIESNALLQ